MTNLNPYNTADPVVDLAQGRPMVVLEAPEQTVAEWSEENDYDLESNYANAKLDTQPDDYVVRCVYLSDIRSEPSKDYTFSTSRVALIDAHRQAARIASSGDSERPPTLSVVLFQSGVVRDGDGGPRMSDYRHATDRIETRLIAECPAGCDVSLLVESEGQEDAVEDLVATVNEVYSECPDCGGEMGVVREIEPTEELE